MDKETDILVVEDEVLIARHIASILKNEGYKLVRTADSVAAALLSIEKRRPSLVLTDITLKGEQTGIDLGRFLYGQYNIPFIYITSHSGSEILDEAKYTCPNAYIIKPFKKEDILVAVQLALFNVGQSQKKHDEEGYYIRKGRALSCIPYTDIYWLKSEENYTAIHTYKKEKFLVRSTISDLHKEFPEPDFMRIHKSYVVNCRHVSEWKSTHVALGKFKLPIGRVYKTLLKDYIL